LQESHPIMRDDPDTPHNESDPAHGSTESTSKKADVFADIAKTFQDTLKSGSEDAQKAFKKATPKATKAVHDLAYGIAYATAFGSALLKGIAPDNITTGFKKGSESGQRAANEVVKRRKERQSRMPEKPEP